MQNNKITKYIYTIAFTLTIAAVGFLSFIKLCNFYINDEHDLIEWTPQMGSKFETDIASNMSAKFTFININGAIRSLLDQRFMNGVVKLNNDYLLTTMDHCSNEKIEEYAQNLSAFNKYLEKRGTALLYASTPYTTSKYDPELPIGAKDYGNDNIDRLLAAFDAEGIDTLDFREVMRNDGIEHYNMMYKTDHHWTTKAGFYAYQKIEDYIVEKTGCTVDPRVSDISNYTVTTYEKWHLGSRGQRTGIYYAGIDDFDLIVPNFETSLRNEYNGKTGSVQDLMIDMTPLENRDYRSKHTYDFVLQNTLGHYTNMNSHNDMKVMLITDSFGYAVGEYMAMGFKDVLYVYDQNSATVNAGYIESYDPDVVIMLCYPQIISDDSTSFDYQSFTP